MTAEQEKTLNEIFGAVSSAHTALVMLSEELSGPDFDRLEKAHAYLIEAEVELCMQVSRG